MVTSNVTVRMALLSVACFACLGVTAADQSTTAEEKPANATNAPEAPLANDKDKLQGKWQLISLAIEDKVIKRSEPLDAWKDTFLNDVLIEGDRMGQAKAGLGKFKLDDSRNPRQITVQDAEGKLTFRGIYSIDGDNLKVCINGDGNDVRRPEEFVTKKGAPLILIELKRAPAARK